LATVWSLLVWFVGPMLFFFFFYVTDEIMGVSTGVVEG
jgi:hypothetical protein